MKVKYFIVINLILINIVFAQKKSDKLDRKIEINKLTTSIEESSVEQTIRTYQTQPTPRMTRRTTTVPHIIDKTCLLTPDTGPCRAKIVMWYFKPEISNCSTFYWGGCQGNGNRYDKYSECRSTCLSHADWKESRPRYCFLNFDYGWCFGADERYYYDRSWGVCKKTIYSGCGGNKNNFDSKEKCDDVCRLATFTLNPRTSPSDAGKKVLIINPSSGNTTAKRGGPHPTNPTADKQRSGSWWVDEFKNKFRNKIVLNTNMPSGEKTKR